MLQIARSAVIKRDVEDVFDYVADFDNFTTWSTGVISATMLTDGPVGVGTKVRMVRQAMGQHYEMLFHLIRFERHRRLAFSGELLGMPFSSQLDFAPLDAGTRVIQSGAVKIPLALFIAEPTVKSVLAHTFESDLHSLKHVLETPQDGHAHGR